MRECTGPDLWENGTHGLWRITGPEGFSEPMWWHPLILQEGKSQEGKRLNGSIPFLAQKRLKTAIRFLSSSPALHTYIPLPHYLDDVDPTPAKG